MTYPIPLVKSDGYDPLQPPPVVVPPINFSLVAPGVYRSGHPNKRNFNFLRGLHLKGIMYVEGDQPYRPDSADFVTETAITLYRYDLSKEADLWDTAGRQRIDDALRVILDTRNHPILLHDDSGKSTVSLLCGLIRRIQGWSLMGVYAEADLFAGPAGGAEGSGVGEAGREFIAMFDPKKVESKKVECDEAHRPSWVA